MSSDSFGSLLGRLILQKRRSAGLTQLQLSEDAFGVAGKTRRISELESGSVANPHPKTIDPIISVLGITAEEIETCAKDAEFRPDEDLDRAYREARNLIDAIARQFEHSKPKASLAELDRFLRAKAQEWVSLRDRIEQIDEADKATSELRAAAADALANGDFDSVDRFLAEAEASHQHGKAVAEIAKLVEIRVTRGHTQILKGDPQQALDHYRTAVEFYRPFDEDEMAREIREIAEYIYESSLRSLAPCFFVAGALLEILVELSSVQKDAVTLARAYYQLGLAYRNEHDQRGSPIKEAALEKAIEYSKLAVETLQKEGSVYHIASSQIGLANCLRDRAKLSLDPKDLESAVRLLSSARELCLEDDESRSLLTHASNSLGAVYSNFDSIGCSDAMPNAPDLALAAFSEAASASEEIGDLETWGGCKFNIGGILAAKAHDPELDEVERHFMRIRAISEFSAASETFPLACFPFRFADTQEALGRVLLEHGYFLGRLELSEAYFFRAIQAFEQAANILSPDLRPQRWAKLQVHLGNVFHCHARMAEPSLGIHDCEKAIEYLNCALEIANGEDWVEGCQKLLQEIEAYRESLLSGADEAASDR